MPSDALLQAALDATSAARRGFLSAVRTAADEVEGRLRAGRDRGRDSAERVAEQIGAFAAGRIDPSKLAAFEPRSVELHPAMIEALERAAGVLREIALLEDDNFVVEVTAGHSLYAAVSDRLAHLGRAFGAAELVALARVGTTASMDADQRLDRYHPDDWTARERELAPPLVIVADGSVLRLSAMRDWLEGAQKLVFIAEGPCPPAPLASLLSPGAWVAQLASEDGLAGFTRFEGPAVAALVPENAALFTHDPATGLDIDVEPEEGGLRAVGPITAWKQREDLRLLRRLSGTAIGTPPLAAANGTVVKTAEPADRLAAWLLKQADVPSAS